jgi:LVIVD repeat
MPRLVGVLVGLLGAAGVLAVPGVAAGQVQSDHFQLLSNVPQAVDASQPAPHFQSDEAFWGNRAYVGNYDGFRIFDISEPDSPKVLVDYKCRGPQNDVSVWQNRLLFLSVDRPQVVAPGQPRGACTTDDPKYATPTSYPAGDPDSFEGIRIFDVSDPAHPQLITGVDTDCGSHTHTLVPDPAHNRLFIYVSSYPLRSGPHCGPQAAAAGAQNVTGGPVDPLMKHISVIEVPLDHPENAAVVSTPQLAQPVFDISVFGATGFNPSVGCHDIQVFLELKLAAAACMSNGQMWDISDLAHPKTLPSQGATYTDRDEVEFWHSASFSNDGSVVIFGDESITGACNAPDEADGRLWFYRRTGGTTLSPAVSSFAVPRLHQEGDCTAHIFDPIQGVRGNVLISSWYTAGTTAIDFTDLAHPREIGFFDAETEPGSLGYWSSYWYRGFVYANSTPRGFDTLLFSHPARAGARRLSHFNPQTQETLAEGAPRGTAASRHHARKLNRHYSHRGAISRQTLLNIVGP